MHKATPQQGGVQGNLPPLYKVPTYLRFEEHRRKAIKPAGDFRFAAGANALPLLIGEFAQAVRHYPIVFTNTAFPFPCAVLGLKEGQNLFLAEDGSWQAGTYVPAYLRRYPFIAVETAERDRRLLAVDVASERIADLDRDPDAQPLFDELGAPTSITEQAAAFCNAYHAAQQASEAFGAALRDRGLLVERRADLKFSDNSHYTLNGFMIVDEAKFRAISDTEILRDWHARGWLAAIVLHLASTQNWPALLTLNAERARPARQGVA